MCHPMLKETDMFDAVDSWNSDPFVDASSYTFTTISDDPIVNLNFLPTPGHTAQVSPSLRGADVSDIPINDFECSEAFDPSQFVSFTEHTHNVFDETMSHPITESAVSATFPLQSGSANNSKEHLADDRMDYFLDGAKSVTLPSFNEPIMAQTSCNSCPVPPPSDEQWLGHPQHLHSSAANPRRAAQPFNEWERRNLEQGIIRGAENFLRQELKSFKQDPSFAEWASMVRNGETASASHMDNGRDTPRVREVKCKVQAGVSHTFADQAPVAFHRELLLTSNLASQHVESVYGPSGAKHANCTMRS
jgi:hypothetical protein